MIKKSLLTLASFACAATAMAGGFKIGMQGQKQIGLGTCGTGLALDASAVYFNPAAMVHTRNQFTGGFNALMPRTQYLDGPTQILTNTVNQTFTPLEMYGTYGFSKKLTGGLGIYTPFGSGVKWPTDWNGRYILTDISLQTIFINPSLAYAINDKWSFGAGFIYSPGKVNLENDLPIQSQNSAAPGHLQLSGNAGGTGFNAGFYFKDKTFSAGLVYRSGVAMSVRNGNAIFSNIPSAASTSFVNTTFNSSLQLPGEIDFGVGLQATKNLLLAFDFSHTLWSSYDSLAFDFAANTDKLKDVSSPRMYHDASTIKGGIQYTLDKRTTVRGGAFYDFTPIDDKYVGPELPDNTKTGLTLGATYNVTKQLAIDFSLLYENVPQRKTTNVNTNLSGTFATRVVAPGIGVTYNFNKPPKPVQRPTDATPSSNN